MEAVTTVTYWSRSSNRLLARTLFFQISGLHAIAIITWIFLPVSSDSMFIPFKVLPDTYIPVPSSAMQYTLSWGVKLRSPPGVSLTENRTRFDLLANEIAQSASLINVGQVGELYGHYLFNHKLFMEALNKTLQPAVIKSIQQATETTLQEHPSVEWVHPQWVRSRSKREISFEDPMYPEQWHLHNSKTKGMDINITEIWYHNISGEGVVVAVIDDGLEWNNPDIRDNYSPEGSWDLNSGDDNPMPELHGKTQNRHGTRCAGEIAAVANNRCGVGVAYGAKVSGIRLLDGPMTDSLEATAFNKHMQINDIYSCSWGPDDDGKTVDGPHPLALAALQHGVNSGRRGRGSIFVVASGNGGKSNDNCNYDGYANSMYTITIGAVDEKGHMPFYAEECSAMLGVTFSSGANDKRNIVTTDWTLGQGKGCTNSHTGTSAAAPIAAGMIALSLQAKPCLSWRDVQHLIVYSSIKIDHDHGDWSENAAGFVHSHKHGFGLISAWHLVNAAKVWRSVPWLTSISSSRLNVNKIIPANSVPLVLEHTVSNSSARMNEVTTLEHVLVTVTLTHPSRGNLSIELTSPSGTKSMLATRRNKDKSPDGLKGWTFSTVRCWGEQPAGTWTLKIFDKSVDGGGILQEWKLVLYGSMMSPSEVQQRRQAVQESMSGEYLDTNLTEPCSFYWNPAMSEDQLLTSKTMRMLLLISALITILAAYYTLEQAFCNQEDKDKYLEEYIEEERARLERSKSSQDGSQERLMETSFQENIHSEADRNQNILPMEQPQIPVETNDSSHTIVRVDISTQCPKNAHQSSASNILLDRAEDSSNNSDITNLHSSQDTDHSGIILNQSNGVRNSRDLLLVDDFSTVQNIGITQSNMEGDLLPNQSAIFDDKVQEPLTSPVTVVSCQQVEQTQVVSELEPFLGKGPV